MTQSSVTRLDRKHAGKKKNSTPHPTRSFDQMVADAQLKALQPYIQQQVGMAAQQIVSNIYQAMMSERAMMQTRQLAFERLLKANTTWFSDDVLAMAVAEVEDESSGFQAVSDEIGVGDKVRLEFAAKHSNATEFTPSSKLAINSVLAKSPQGTYQTHEELEKAVLGLKVGESREFLIPEQVAEGKEPENTTIRAKIIRVSRKPAPVAKKEETGEQQTSNA